MQDWLRRVELMQSRATHLSATCARLDACGSEESIQLIKGANHCIRLNGGVGIVGLSIWLALPAEPDALHAYLLWPPHIVAQAVAKHHCLARRHVEQRQSVSVDTGVRLTYAEVSRGDNDVKVAVERCTGDLLTLEIGCSIGQQCQLAVATQPPKCRQRIGEEDVQCATLAQEGSLQCIHKSIVGDTVGLERRVPRAPPISRGPISK